VIRWHAPSPGRVSGWRVIQGEGKERAFIFARGSRTEAGVWRVIVDDPDPSGEELARVARSMTNHAVAPTDH